MSWPPICAVPSVGCRIPHSIRITVVFPEPFGPRKPKIDPFPTVNEIWSTAVKVPKRFVSPSTSIIGSDIRSNQEGGSACPKADDSGPCQRVGDNAFHLTFPGFLIHFDSSPHFTFGK